MRTRLLLPLAAVCGLLTAACDDGRDTTAPGENPASDGSTNDELGMIELSLDAGDLAFDELTASITVTPSAGGTAINVARTLSGLGVQELIRVAPGTYTVAVAVTQEGDATPAYTGQVSDVSVLAGQRSAVAVPLTPTGGVQISVMLPTLGGEFACQATVDISGAEGAGLAGVVGAQRVERGADNVWRPTYYLWLCSGSSCRMVKTATLDGAKNPLWNPATAVTTNLAPPNDGSSLWATGSGFFMIDEQTVLQSPDGITWSSAAKMPAASFTRIPGTDSSGGQLRGCGVFVDDAVHRLCNVIDEFKPASGNANLMGLAMASSPDGLLWDAFPPVSADVTDRVAMPEVEFVESPRLRAGHPEWWENEEQLVGTAMHGGVYHAIVAQMATRTVSGQLQQQVYGFVTHSTSDGAGWVRREATTKCAIPAPRKRPGWALFVVDGVLHIYYPTSATDLAHLTSAK